MHHKGLLASLAVFLLVVSGCASSEAKKKELFENGKRLAAEKRYVEAILQFRNALQLDDKYADARVQLAEALAMSGNPEGAYSEYQRAADLLPNDPAVQTRAATLLFMAGQFEDVRTRVQAVLKKNPKDIDAQLLYANALVGLKDLEGGVKQIEEAIQIDPANASTYTNLALLKLAQGQREAAEAAFKKAVELDPKSMKARLALTYFQMSTGNVPLAEQSLNEALALDPNDALTNRTLAALYMGTGREAMAEKPLKTVVEVTKSARSKFALADYYVRVNRGSDARAVLEPLVKGRDTYVDAQVRIAELTYNGGNRAAAKKLVDDVLRRYPSHPLPLQVRAKWLLVDGRPAQALEAATAAVNAAPRDVGALYLHGTLQAMNGQREGAVKTFNDILRLNPRAVAAQVQLSQLSLRGGDAESAVGLAQEAVSNNPRSAEARLVLARALISQRELARADVELNRLLAAFPAAPGVNAAKGTLELLKNNHPAARTAFQRAFDAEPTSIAAIGGLTILDMQQQRVAEARDRLEKRLAAQPKRADLLVLAARVYIAEKNLRKAEQVLKEALDVAPRMPEVYSILLDVYRATDRLDGARAEFDALVERNPAHLGARTMAAVIVHSKGNLQDAKRRYVQVIALDPRAAVAANNLANIYADEKQNLDEALGLAERSTELIPDYAEAWDTLGWVYQRKQLPLLAIAPFQKAVSQGPDNAVFHYHLGMALAGAGDQEKARESLQMALKLQPSFPDAEREMKALTP
jgi:putative PEP-CTERM system TPR-repeat lipoprotein